MLLVMDISFIAIPILAEKRLKNEDLVKTAVFSPNKWLTALNKRPVFPNTSEVSQMIFSMPLEACLVKMELH